MERGQRRTGGRVATWRGATVAVRPLESKLRPPRPQVALVYRHRLVLRLLNTSKPVVLVSAPAGSGKTVAVMQWAARDDRPIAWLRLDPSDNDPVVLLAHLAVALDRVVGVDAAVLELLQQAEAPRKEDVLAGLVEAVAQAGPFGLVLDDCHLVENRQCWEGLAAIVGELPARATVVLTSRVDPSLPLGRLKSEGRLGEVRFGDLALDRDETSELARLHGVAADDRELAALLELTEGWAAGIYLGLLAAGDCAGDWLSEVRGDQRAIASYLLDEVLERQPAGLQVFLEQTSILDELTASLCAAVTGRADAGAVLVRLARDNLFVSALDDHDERFRYHHLFAELLRARLERRGGAEARRRHLLAAAWYEAHGEAEPAIRHYLAAGDVEATVDLAALAADTLIAKGLVESARRLLLLYTAERLLAHPVLAVAGGWVFALAAGTREEQRRWTRLMMDLQFEDGPTPLAAASLRSSWLAIVAELCPDGLTQARKAFEETWRLEKDRPGEWRRMAKGGLARTHYLIGSADMAARMYHELLAEPPSTDEWTDVADAAGDHAWLALIAQDAGRWAEAEEHVAEAERLQPEMGFDYPIHFSGYLDMLLSHLRLMSHKADPDTMAFARRVDEFAAEMVHNAPWVLLFRDVVLGEVALEQGDLAAARRWCDRALRTLAGWRDAGLYGRRARQLADALERRVMAEPLTPAERRVLDMLPSHLPIKQVAGRLNLSHSTVKTHLRAVYRKLEVSSRAEAIERARSLGLLRT